MSSFEGQLRLSGDAEAPIGVEVNLRDDQMMLKSGDMEIAAWQVDDIRVSALEDGFHIRAEGEEVILDVVDDAKFAVELGLRNAHPALRQRMARLLRDQE